MMFNKFKKWFHFWIIAKPVPKAEVVDEKPKAEPKLKLKLNQSLCVHALSRVDM